MPGVPAAVVLASLLAWLVGVSVLLALLFAWGEQPSSVEGTQPDADPGDPPPG